MKPNEIIIELLKLRNQTHIFHWQTTPTLSAHLALGELYDAIDGSIDELAEVLTGRFGPLDLNHTQTMVNIPSTFDPVAYCGAMVRFLESWPAEVGTGVLAIRDDLLNATNRVQYKLRQFPT